VTPCRTVEAFFYDEEATTDLSSEPAAVLATGTAAAYLASTGALIESHSWAEGGNRATFTRIPEAEVHFYAVGNRNFTWPSNARELKDIGFDADIKDGSIPFSSMINPCKHPQTEISIGLERLHARITLSKGDCGLHSFTATRIYAKDCPSVMISATNRKKPFPFQFQQALKSLNSQSMSKQKKTAAMISTSLP